MSVTDIVAWFRPRALFLLGVAALLVPTLISLGRWSWSTETGAHGPIVLATGLWLIFREGDAFRQGERQPLFPAALPLFVLFPAYAVGRVTSILAIESLSLYGILLVLAYLRWGEQVLRRLWFPIVYFLFLITPPENFLFVATRPIKYYLSETAVDVLRLFGYAVGRTGVTIQIDGYQLLVATACAGVNSLIGITAVSLFYVHLRRGDTPRYALLLTSLLLPIAIFANFVRIVLLVLITHYFGEAAAQGVTHQLAGIGMFLLALILLLALDSALQPIRHRFERNAG